MGFHPNSFKIFLVFPTSTLIICIQTPRVSRPSCVSLQLPHETSWSGAQDWKQEPMHLHHARREDALPLCDPALVTSSPLMEVCPAHSFGAGRAEPIMLVITNFTLQLCQLQMSANHKTSLHSCPGF